MNIIYIEPFYSGAHKQWIDSYKEKSSYNIKILSLLEIPTKEVKKNIVVNYSNLFEELKNLISESEKNSQTKINSININVPATDSFSEYYDSQIIINDEKISDLHLKI